MNSSHLAIGTDIVHIPPFALQLADLASAFVSQTFTPGELAYANGAPSGTPAQHLAARFAAKEAALKALDHASAMRQIEPPVISLRDIEIHRDARGRPSLTLHGSAGMLAEQLAVNQAQVSLSHDGDYAIAFVQIALG